jgi:hypothetical protein
LLTIEERRAVSQRARYGWESNFPLFASTPSRTICHSLAAFVREVSAEQERAWTDCVPALQREVREIIDVDPAAGAYSTILEYELPLESRRPDVILLTSSGIVVLELKGKLEPSQADIDQAAAYARDLRNYHRACADREVEAVLVPTRASGYSGIRNGVHVCGPDALDAFVRDLGHASSATPVRSDVFLSEDAYCPLPTLIQAARELFQRREVRSVWRARAETDPAVDRVASIIHEAARTKSRHLVLVTGVPGAGKTLVGLRTVHAHFLDDLAVARNGQRRVPAVFLSGNGPLVEVLQYELRAAGGDGKAFVRGVKEYVRRYSRRQALVPPEHVLVFDEAQRAYDSDQVQAKHADTPGFEAGRSEPEHFIDFAGRIPEWCVVVGLIGGGQEIHIGEEAGVGQWSAAVESSSRSGEWQVHGPLAVAEHFEHSSVPYHCDPVLNLDTEIRQHQATGVHAFVANMLAAKPAIANKRLATKLDSLGFHLRVTRDLNVAKQYLHDRYREDPESRYGLVASSKDRQLVRFGIQNDFQSTKRVRFGPWYGDQEDAPRSQSCRHLTTCVTEFGAQGLELDAVLLAWGTDLILTLGRWSNALASGYRNRQRVRNPFQLRLNAYRVLLTRGRDATVVFVPALAELDETFEYLRDSGFQEL